MTTQQRDSRGRFMKAGLDIPLAPEGRSCPQCGQGIGHAPGPLCQLCEWRAPRAKVFANGNPVPEDWNIPESAYEHNAPRPSLWQRILNTLGW